MANYIQKQFAKYVAGIPLTIATLGLTFIGNCTSHKDDLPPFYINKTGKSYGICVGGAVRFEENAEFNGLVLSLGNMNRGKINGANISLIANTAKGANASVNGLELSLIANASDTSDSSKDSPEKINGVQASIVYNEAGEGSKGLQIGLCNKGYNKENIANKRWVLNPLGVK